MEKEENAEKKIYSIRGEQFWLNLECIKYNVKRPYNNIRKELYFCVIMVNSANIHIDYVYS